MLLLTRWICNSFLLLSLVSCAAIDKDYRKTKHVGPMQKVYFANFDQVWRATQLAIAHLQIRINNVESGILETDPIDSVRAWRPPGKSKRISSGQRYVLKIRVVRGRSKRQNSVKVVIEKLISLQRSFVHRPKLIPSNGLEEQVILYRIGRELTVERAIEKASKNVK